MTGRDAVAVLERLRLLGAREIVRSGVSVRDASSRHGVHLVERPIAAVVKCAGAAAGGEALERERDLLCTLGAAGAGIGPRVLGWDPVQQALVTELLPGSTLAELAADDGWVAATLASRLGVALASLHRRQVPGVARDAVEPGVLRAHRPYSSALRALSAGQLALLRLLQRSPEACRGLDSAIDHWRPSAAIHGDLRWTNVIVPEPGAGASDEVRLVDWELGGWGDPCWDVGSAMAAHVGGELCHGPPAPERHAAMPMAALWRAWAEGMGLDHASEATALERAARLVGARLIQTAFEVAGDEDRLGLLAVRHAQAGVDLLARPTELVVLIRAWTGDRRPVGV